MLAFPSNHYKDKDGIRKSTLKLNAYKLTSSWRGYESNNIINSNQCYSSDI